MFELSCRTHSLLLIGLVLAVLEPARAFAPGPGKARVLRGYCDSLHDAASGTAHNLCDVEPLPSRRSSTGSVLAAVLAAAGASAVTASVAKAADGRRKTAVVTGANSGIGLATATELAKRGWEIIPACRSKDATDDAADIIGTLVDGAKVTRLDAICQLGDLKTVGVFGRALRRRDLPIDALLLNAGIDGAPFKPTAQGHEQHFGINHLGHFGLWMASKDLLEKAPDGARVVTVTSSAALDADFNLEDLDWQKREYKSHTAYGTSKACNLLFTDELARRYAASGSKVIANAVDPGPTFSQIVRYNLPQRAIQREAMGPKAREKQAKMLGLNTPEQAATGLVWLADTPEGAKSSGQLYVGPNLSIPLDIAWRSEANAKKLWEKSESLVSEYALGPIL